MKAAPTPAEPAAFGLFPIIPPISRRRRWLLIAVGLAPLLLVIGGLAYIEFCVNTRLAAAIAAADLADPGWRLDDIYDDRDIPLDDENSAVIVADVHEMLPENWLWVEKTRVGGDEEAAERYERINAALVHDPNRLVDVPTRAAIEFEVERLATAIDLARRLADWPSGGTDLDRPLNPLETPLPHTQNTRDVARLLNVDVLARSLDGEPDGAIESCRALLNSGRSIGDEPLTISMLVRFALDGLAIEAIERALAMGEPSDASLGLLQDLLAVEDAVPHLLIGCRGERAMFAAMMERLASGELPIDALSGGPGKNRQGPMSLQGAWMFRENESIGLEIFQKAIAAAAGPVEGRIAKFDFFEKELKQVPPWRGGMVRLMMPTISSEAVAESRVKSLLRCAMAAVAAERFRRAHGMWPASLEALVPVFLPSLPIDPFGGGPILMARRDDGLTIYARGLDNEDDGGRVLRRYGPSDKHFDLGIRLYDVDARALPADPPGAPDNIPPPPLDSPPASA